jgi:hypothetical protein
MTREEMENYAEPALFDNPRLFRRNQDGTVDRNDWDAGDISAGDSDAREPYWEGPGPFRAP